MVTYFLFALCIIAAINITLLFRINPKQSGAYPVLFFAVFVSCVGHLFLALSTNLDQVILANKMNYVGAIFLPLLTFYACLSICNFRFPYWGYALLLIATFAVYGLAATVGYNDIYYKTIEFVQINGAGNYVATYGWGHDVFNVMMVGYAIANISLIVYTFIKKKNVSYKSLIALSLLEFSSIFAFFISRFLESDTLVMPIVYVFDQFVLLYINYRIMRYDMGLTVLNVLEESNTSGYISISSSNHFLGCNEFAYQFFPELRNCRVDHHLKSDKGVIKFLKDWAKELANGSTRYENNFENDERHYKCTVRRVAFIPMIKLRWSMVRSKKFILLFKIEDDTKLHKYVKMLGSNNVRMEMLLRNNEGQIRAMQERMIIGMSDMVESRDTNTGGHIKRTSKVIAILAEALKESGTTQYSEQFYNRLISAAPMHDIGKIAIDDQILRKPGKFTREEFNIMKQHPEKGAIIVENLLSPIESPEFVQLAKNVAWYHHERFDGSGYPKRLKGAEIPFEARVMAVADVYDALVSKRCYKEKFSFEKAYSIIIEGMGTQFDPALKDCFIACRSKLEEYYSNLNENVA